MNKPDIERLAERVAKIAGWPRFTIRKGRDGTVVVEPKLPKEPRMRTLDPRNPRDNAIVEAERRAGRAEDAEDRRRATAARSSSSRRRPGS
jgi:hypothetical protein